MQLQSLSCASTGNCSAVGGYDDALGDSQGLLVTEAGGRWQQAVEAQAPAGAAVQPFRLADGGGLVAVSCPATGDCTAVGRYTDSRRTDHGVLLSERRGHWSRGVPLRLPADAITPPRPKSGTVNLLGLADVSCSSVGNCVAVGNYETNAEVWEPMVVAERHGSWSQAVRAPLPAGAPVEGQNAVLLSVTCNHAGRCSAVGEYVDPAGHQQTLLVSGSGESWTTVPAPSPPSDAAPDPDIIPSSIACASPGECAAVGTYLNPLQNSLGVLLNESAGRWAGSSGAVLPSDAAPAGTAGDQTVVLSSVACPQAGSCTAVGWYFDNYENGQGLLISQSHGLWQPGAKVVLPVNAVGGLEKQSAGLDWISCASVGNCLATGVYTDIGYNSQALLLSEVDGDWQAGVESPLPRDAGQQQYAVANQADCTGAGDCTVIGQYDNHRGDVLGYMLSEQGGAWSHATELRLPPVSATEARLSLKAILTPQRRPAELAKIRSSRHFDYEYQAVQAGIATTAWFTSQAGRRVLIATGRVHVRIPGRIELRLNLTARGWRVLRTARRVRVMATASFRPAARDRHRVSAGTDFTLS